jgi:hypothetical protein
MGMSSIFKLSGFGRSQLVPQLSKGINRLSSSPKIAQIDRLVGLLRVASSEACVHRSLKEVFSHIENEGIFIDAWLQQRYRRSSASIS